MKDKTFYIATVLWIAVLAFGFNLLYDEAHASQITVVLALIGTAFGWATSIILRKFGIVESKEK